MTLNMNFASVGCTIPDYYESLNSFNVIFCPNCGAMNTIKLDWCGSIQGLIFCIYCGKEI